MDAFYYQRHTDIINTIYMYTLYTVPAIVYKNQCGKDNNTLVHVDLFSMFTYP